MIKTAVSEYGFINAKLRSRISRILTEEFRMGLASSDSLEAAAHFLSVNGFESAARQWDATGDLQSLEFELFCSHIANYRMVMKNTVGSLHDFVNVLSIKPEIENIKSVIRLWYGSRIRKRPIGHRSAYIYKQRIYENIDWERLVNAIGFDDIVRVFESTIYSGIFSDKADIRENEGLFGLETSLDKLYYSYINSRLSELRKSDAEIVREIISTEIDLQNVGWLIRYRHFYRMDFDRLSGILIPGGSGLNLSDMKKNASSDTEFTPADLLKKSYPELSALSISDRHNFSNQAMLFENLLDEARKRKFNSLLSGYPFTIGIILVYFFMSEREQQFISSVLNGKNYKLSTERIKELLE